MKRCMSCDTENDDRAWACTNCGASDFGPLPAQRVEPTSRPSRRWAWAAASAIGTVLLVAVVAMASGRGSTEGYDTFRAQAPLRLTGNSPIAASIEISKLGWRTANVAVLVADDDPAAAAVAGPIASKYSGPVLLTTKDGLPAEVQAELERLNVTAVVLVGAEGRLNPAINRAISGFAQVQVISGTDDYAMADAAARDITRGKRAVEIIVMPLASVATIGPVAGGYSARFGVPVLFSDERGALRTDSKLRRSLDPSNVIVMGEATGAIAASLGAPSMTSLPLTDTGTQAARFAEYAFAQEMEYTTLFIVRRSDIAYARALGPLAGQDKYRSPLLVTDDDALGSATTEFLNDHASSIKTIRFLGPGGPQAAAIKEAALDAATTMISKRALVLDGATATAVRSFDLATGTMQIDAAKMDEKSVAVGTVLVAPPMKDSPGGLLRRVLSVEGRGDALVVSTEQASLTDIVAKGSLDLRSPSATPGGEATSATVHAVDDPRVVTALYRESSTNSAASVRSPSLVPCFTIVKPGTYTLLLPPDPVTIPLPKLSIGVSGGPTASFRPRAAVGVGVVIHATFVPIPRAGWYEPQSRVSRFGVALRNTVEFGAELSAVVAVDLAKPGTANTTKDVATIPLGTLAGAIGVVPIWADLTLEPYVEAGVTWKSTFALEGTVTVDSQIGFDVLFDGRGNQEVRPIGGMGITPSWRLSYKGALEAEAAAGVKIGLNLYSVVGPYAAIECFLKGIGGGTQLVAGSDVPGTSFGEGNAEVGFGLRPSVGGQFEVIDGAIDFSAEWKPEDEQLAEMGLYRVLWKGKGPGAARGPEGSIVYVSGDGVWRLDLATKRRTRLVGEGARPGHVHDGVNWTPDRRFVVVLPGGTHYDTGIWIADLTTGRVTADLDYGQLMDIEWTADRSGVMAAGTRETSAAGSDELVRLVDGRVSHASKTERAAGVPTDDYEGPLPEETALEDLARNAARMVGLPDKPNTNPEPIDSWDDTSRRALVGSARWKSDGWGLLSVNMKSGIDTDEHGDEIHKIFLVGPAGELTYLADGYGAAWMNP